MDRLDVVLKPLALYAEMDGDCQWNPRHMFRPIWYLSTEHTCNPELMFTPGSQPSSTRLKRCHVVHLITGFENPLT